MTIEPTLIADTSAPTGNHLRNTVALPSPGVGPEAVRMDETLRQMRVWRPNAFVGGSKGRISEDSFFEARLNAKLLIANVAMHIRDSWRTSLFRQLDDLFDINEWDPTEPFPSSRSIGTFLRMIIRWRFTECPGLGVTQGRVVAAWTNNAQRLTIECLPDDQIHWVMSHSFEGLLEIASGLTKTTRLSDVIAPYIQGHNWVLDADNQP